jgi:hypothetical protein
MSQELTIIQPQERAGQGLIQQVASNEEIKTFMLNFQKLKGAILSDSDYQPYRQWVKNPNGPGGQYVEKRFIKKSGWKNLAMALGISVEPINAPIRTDLGEGHYAITREVKATAPNGRYAVGEGSCDTKEERFKKYQGKGDQRTFVGYEEPKFHDISSTAYTRAANRAISDLVGGGEVSAEEVENEANHYDGPAMLSDGYYNRLLSVAREIDSEAGRVIAELILPKVGRYFSQEDAIALGKELKRLVETSKAVTAQIVEPLDEVETASLEEQGQSLGLDLPQQDPTDYWLAEMEKAVDLDHLAQISKTWTLRTHLGKTMTAKTNLPPNIKSSGRN